MPLAKARAVSPIGNSFFGRAHGKAAFPFLPLCFRGRIDLPENTDPAMPAAAASVALLWTVSPWERVGGEVVEKRRRPAGEFQRVFALRGSAER